MNSARVQKVLDRLHLLHSKVIDFGLDRTLSLLAKLDNPQCKLPLVIHISGTNGKGSILSFIEYALRDAGKLVHRYTSPELVKFNERIMLAGELISDDDLIEILQHVERVNAGNPITFFEITTVACLYAFSTIKADVVLLETGMGGLFDSTNVIPTTAINIISSISIDHAEFLGNTLAQIAINKAGIIRNGARVVVAPQPNKDAVRVVQARSNELGTKPLLHKIDWNYKLLDDGFNISYEGLSVDFPTPSLQGKYQFANASTAVIACLELKSLWLDITMDNIKNGVKYAVHRGRFEEYCSGKMDIKKASPVTLDSLLCDKIVYLDGGHNTAGGDFIRDNLARLDAKDIIVVCAMLEGKDSVGFIKPFAKYIETLYTVEPRASSTQTAPFKARDELARIFMNCGINKVISRASFNEVLGDIIILPKGKIVLFTGSMHLIGEVLSWTSELLKTKQS